MGLRGPAKKRRIKHPVEDDGAGRLDTADWLAQQLKELRCDTRSAAKDRSWQSVAALRRQEREVWSALKAARAVADATDPDEALTPDQALHQVILPAVRAMGRPLVEEIYRVCLEVLGLQHDDAPPPGIQ